MAKKVTLIPARSNQSTAENLKANKLRMAAYCRVSTDQEDQLSSFEAQCTYYNSYIEKNPDYEMAGIYADEGLSGTNTKKREQFNRMIEDCKAGRVDIIITKSISRFARNTLDCLNFVRLLKDLGIGVIFEKENIFTLDGKGEVLMSILASLAQDESRSISENSQWGIRRRFEQGKMHINTTKFLGYDKDESGNLIINEEQAKVVRRIYRDYLSGKGPNRIAKDLEREGILNWNGKSKWYESTVRKILSNEKYKGDALLQKTYTIDFLSKKRAENNGEVPMYYVEDSHPAIIEKDVWEAVQLEIGRRSAFAERHGITRQDYSSDSNPFAGKVICGECGGLFGRKVWNSTNKKLRRVIWQCNHKYEEKGKVLCQNRHVDEELLNEAVIKAFEYIRDNSESYISKWEKDQQNGNPLIRHNARRLINAIEEQRKYNDKPRYEIVDCVKVYSNNIESTLIDGTRKTINCE